LANFSTPGRPETILVVDDNELVLKVVAAMLQRAGFRVLSAASGLDALRLAEETDGRIELLLSDVDMPAMSGRDLGEALKQSRPEIHVMLMSGGDHGNPMVLKSGWAFIQKPFAPPQLIRMITEMLQSRDGRQSGGQEFSRCGR
jgi:two-component system cell cycle sensor histidine kinase/response regulator CckA